MYNNLRNINSFDDFKNIIHDENILTYLFDNYFSNFEISNYFSNILSSALSRLEKEVLNFEYDAESIRKKNINELNSELTNKNLEHQIGIEKSVISVIPFDNATPSRNIPINFCPS